MCMEFSPQSRKRAERLRKKAGFRYMYKVVEVDAYRDTNTLESPYYTYRWYPGWNKSGRPKVSLTSWEACDSEISEGMHLYTSRKEAMASFWYLLPGNNVVIRLKCYNKDCVAFSKDGIQAVYQKVFLARKDYDKAIAEKG